MSTLPMTAQIDHVVRYFRQQGKSRSEVLAYFAPEDRANAGAEYDRQRAAIVNKPSGPLAASCPACGAQSGEPCRKPGGEPWGTVHEARASQLRRPEARANQDRVARPAVKP